MRNNGCLLSKSIGLSRVGTRRGIDLERSRILVQAAIRPPARWKIPAPPLARFIVIGLLLFGTRSLSAQFPPSAGVSMTSDQTRQSVQWLAHELMMQVPPCIDGDDDWGETKKVWAGVKVHRDGWELKTHRRWRELRHGRWLRYEIELSEQNTAPASAGSDSTAASVTVSDGNVATLLQPYAASDVVTIHSVTAVTSDAGLQSWRADATVATPARFAVRVERWNLGMKWYSIEISGKMNVSMRSTLTMGMSADFAEVPPAVELNVNVEKASLSVDRFEVERISKLGGDAAEEIGDLAENTIGKVWIRKENTRLVDRLNDAIADNRDSLRWSMADWLVQLAP
ncbi:hypothetical protein [Allorhodopirellula solitaria]|nr:hypothetical protein [Allorhodopirellula solitaria]